jgi:hypothetical protein
MQFEDSRIGNAMMNRHFSQEQVELTSRPSLGGLGFSAQPDLIARHNCEIQLMSARREIDFS